METTSAALESLFEKIETYGKTTYQLSKLKTLETSAIVATMVISRLTVILTLSMFMLVLSLGVAMLLGEVLGRPYYGYFIVSGFYFLMGAVLHLFLHRWLKKPISDFIIAQSLQQERYAKN